MTLRLPRLTPTDLDAEQRVVYDSIVGGSRASMAQHFPLTADDGSLNGPFAAMLLTPPVGQRLQDLGAAIRFSTELTPRCREIAILQVAHALGSEFEWWAHERVGRAIGLSDDELTALSLGSFSTEDPLETAVSAFCTNLLHSSAVTDDEFAVASRLLTARQLTELTVLVGYYRLLEQVMTVFAIGAPDEDPGSRAAHGHGH